jgi:TrmH family RNA methyltransferase
MSVDDTPRAEKQMRLLTLARDLTRRKARDREGMFVVEGIRTGEELVRSTMVGTVGVLAAPQLPENPRGAALLEAFAARGIPVTHVTDREFQSAAETESPQGFLAVARIPRDVGINLPSDGTCRFLVLDAVQDPGNVGTLIRTAAALGTTAVLALPGTVDEWNAKVVRSAMGAHFHFLATGITWEGVQELCASTGTELGGPDMGGANVASLVPPSRCALVVGNEGSGLSPHVRAALTQVVSLPISPIVESLNVAVAAGILLYELRVRHPW